MGTSAQPEVRTSAQPEARTSAQPHIQIPTNNNYKQESEESELALAALDDSDSEKDSGEDGNLTTKKAGQGMNATRFTRPRTR